MYSSCHLATVEIFSLLVCLAIISTALGCGQMPFGQVRAVNFTVSGFTVPSAMAFSAVAAVQSQVPQISRNAVAASALVRNLVMQAVNDVLEERGRSEGLPGFIISGILGQLTIEVNYTPINCAAAYLMAAQQQAGVAMGCFIISDTLIAICNGANCDPTMNMVVTIVSPENMRITGSVRTTNLIMAFWTTQMWQGVFSRALQSIRSGPFRTNFAAASVTVM